MYFNYHSTIIWKLSFSMSKENWVWFHISFAVFGIQSRIYLDTLCCLLGINRVIAEQGSLFYWNKSSAKDEMITSIYQHNRLYVRLHREQICVADIIPNITIMDTRGNSKILSFIVQIVFVAFHYVNWFLYLMSFKKTVGYIIWGCNECLVSIHFFSIMCSQFFQSIFNFRSITFLFLNDFLFRQALVKQ